VPNATDDPECTSRITLALPSQSETIVAMRPPIGQSIATARTRG